MSTHIRKSSPKTSLFVIYYHYEILVLGNWKSLSLSVFWISSDQIRSDQSLSHVRLFATP